MEDIIESELDSAILFRTTTSEVYKNTMEDGSIWLRSAQYYRELEDKVRNDRHEGVNGARIEFPIKVMGENGVKSEIIGDGTGSLGQQIIPHYIASFHGVSISKEQHSSFGSYTFGVKSLTKLSAEILFKVSQIVDVTGYRYGPIAYQYTSLVRTQNTSGGIYKFDDKTTLSAIKTDVLIKRPLEPFISQDEWRIVIFTKGLYKNDPAEPLRINVDTNHFYSYLKPE
jgi:hypothetical protein